MTRKYIRKRSTNKLATLIVSALLALVIMGFESCKSQNKSAPQKPKANNQIKTEKTLENVTIVSVYDGDTFKINLPCETDVFCENISVRVRGVDTPEIKGKTEREKTLAKQAKAFTKEFLSHTPVSLTECGRDKYFRLLCNVTNGQGKDLGEELIAAGLGYSYQGGTKSKQFQ
jgi:endonuclease YncB( thermonuclease family)